MKRIALFFLSVFPSATHGQRQTGTLMVPDNPPLVKIVMVAAPTDLRVSSASH